MSAKKEGKENKSSRLMVVVSTDIHNYTYQDSRSLKPLCVDSRNHPDPKFQVNVAFQEADRVRLNNKKAISYFVPNNIALLLSNSKKALQKAESIYTDSIKNHSESSDPKCDELWKNCTLVSDYIELIQTAIVFGYTALESFANISIPEDYTYKPKSRKKGIQELYDKEGIERWLSLSEKFKLLLPDIYHCSKLPNKLWDQFINLEKSRHSIVHQKSIERTRFMFEYFNPKIFETLKTPEKVITYFQNNNKISTSEQYKSHLLWPWVEGDAKFPVTTDVSAILDWHVLKSQD